MNKPKVHAAPSVLTEDIGKQLKNDGAIRAVPASVTPNIRNDMYLASDTVWAIGPRPAGLSEADIQTPVSRRTARLTSLYSSLA